KTPLSPSPVLCGYGARGGGGDRTFSVRSLLIYVLSGVSMILRQGGPVGKVECITVAGLDLWFNSHDHRPPHFHVRRPGEYELRVLFLLCSENHLEYEVKWGEAPSKKMLETLRELAVEHRAVLLTEWEQKVCQ